MPPTLPVSYTSVTQMYLVLPDLGSSANVTSAQLANFAGGAEAQINATIVQKYTLPITGDIGILTTLATEIAIYKVLSQRLFSAERLATSPWPDRYRDSLATLDRIAAGELLLVTTSGQIVAGRLDTAEIYYTTKDCVPTFWE